MEIHQENVDMFSLWSPLFREKIVQYLTVQESSYISISVKNSLSNIFEMMFLLAFCPPNNQALFFGEKGVNIICCSRQLTFLPVL